jgi:hypothetical protein
MAPFAERKRDADRAFVPLLDLNPGIWDNAFGVYVIEFHAKSGLSDDNASRLLQLNELPSKYDLTLVLETNKITDVSIPVLAKLISTDLIIAADSGITDSGIAKLDTLLPKTLVPARERKAARGGVLVGKSGSFHVNRSLPRYKSPHLGSSPGQWAKPGVEQSITFLARKKRLRQRPVLASLVCQTAGSSPDAALVFLPFHIWIAAKTNASEPDLSSPCGRGVVRNANGIFKTF